MESRGSKSLTSKNKLSDAELRKMFPLSKHAKNAIKHAKESASMDVTINDFFVNWHPSLWTGKKVDAETTREMLRIVEKQYSSAKTKRQIAEDVKINEKKIFNRIRQGKITISEAKARGYSAHSEMFEEIPKQSEIRATKLAKFVMKYGDRRTLAGKNNFQVQRG